jgi:hypothetical protein
MRKLVTAGVVVMVVCLALSAVALASSVRGTIGKDRIRGTSGSDSINGTDGDDKIDARDGAVDTGTCGAGDDVAKLDEDDVIADATEENPNRSCEHVFRGRETDHEHSREDCPRGEGGQGSRGDGDRPHWGAGDHDSPGPSEES